MASSATNVPSQPPSLLDAPSSASMNSSAFLMASMLTAAVGDSDTAMGVVFVVVRVTKKTHKKPRLGARAGFYGVTVNICFYLLF